MANVEWAVTRGVTAEELMRKDPDLIEKQTGIMRVYLLLEQWENDRRPWIELPGGPRTLRGEELKEKQRGDDEKFITEAGRLVEEGVITLNDFLTSLLEHRLETIRLYGEVDNLRTYLPEG